MKATGIVRRIDDLGCVVIPKEIRLTMSIKEGDPLEIYTDRDGEVDVTVACGISDYVSALDTSFGDVFNRADAKMYICKQQMKEKLKQQTQT